MHTLSVTSLQSDKEGELTAVELTNVDVYFGRITLCCSPLHKVPRCTDGYALEYQRKDTCNREKYEKDFGQSAVSLSNFRMPSELTQRPDDAVFDKLLLRCEPQQKETKRYLD